MTLSISVNPYAKTPILTSQDAGEIPTFVDTIPVISSTGAYGFSNRVVRPNQETVFSFGGGETDIVAHFIINAVGLADIGVVTTHLKHTGVAVYDSNSFRPVQGRSIISLHQTDSREEMSFENFTEVTLEITLEFGSGTLFAVPSGGGGGGGAVSNFKELVNLIIENTQQTNNRPHTTNIQPIVGPNPLP